jgi:magnesium chelatase family protein
MGPAEVSQFCAVDAGKPLLKAVMQQLGMSARTYHRILKLARTIADLADSERDRDGPPGGGDPIPSPRRL